MEPKSRCIAIVLCWLYALANLESALSAQPPLSVLIAAFPAAGHINPSANLGEELVRRGHSVTLITIESKGIDLARERAEAGGMKYVSAGNASFSVSQLQDVYAASAMENVSLGNMSATFKKSLKVLDWLPEVANKIGKYLDHQNLTKYDMIISTEFPAATVACLSKKWNVRAMILGTTLQYQNEHLPPWPFPPNYMYKRGTLFTSDNLNFFRRFLSTLYLPLLHMFMNRMFIGKVVNDLELECPDATYAYLRYFHGTNAPHIVPTTIGFEYPRLISPLTTLGRSSASNLSRFRVNCRPGWTAN